jgi:hypothetical protein
MIRFVTASHHAGILTANLLRSPILKKYSCHTIPGFTNIPAAYNTLNDFFAQEQVTAKDNIVIYVHHDVYLPESFEKDLEKALERVPGDWAVLGVAGVKIDVAKPEWKTTLPKLLFGYILDRGKQWGSPWKLPAEVDTLDEMLLITRGDMVFDEQLPQDFYGADICMQARQQGKKCYAISAYCEHNSTRKMGERTPSFFESQEKFKNKWKDFLPIATTCAIVN